MPKHGRTHDTQPNADSAHFISTRHLSDAFIGSLFSGIRKFSELADRGEAFPKLLAELSIGHLFFENSTRTRLSFEAAIQNLGGRVYGVPVSTSSLSKGESVTDTVENILAITSASQKLAAMIVRSKESQALSFLSERFPSLSWINAGDGTHEHPTQALLDAYTLYEKLGPLDGKKISIFGDVLHSRVARSGFWLLKKLGAKVVFCGPHSMIPSQWIAEGATIETQRERALDGAAAVMALRIQHERHGIPLVPSLQEFSKFWSLDETLLRSAGSPWLLHPGPVNWGVELHPELKEYKNSLILRQVRLGVFARMAVLSKVLRSREYDTWVS
jgi:aspartate carbamoyltransferase catalytic subunit